MSVTASANEHQFCGRYTLIAKLGAGGQGEVWRALDHAEGVEVALKVLSGPLAQSETAWKVLQNEYAIANRLQDDAILKIYPPVRDAQGMALPM